MLIEVLVQLNGTIKDDLNRVSHAINTARAAMRAPDSMTVFGPRWERDEYGHICAVRYRCSDTHPAGNYRVWELLARPMEFHADAQGSAVAA
ncbi:hypothetical protein LI168_03090 [Desulfovibrio desulfuricans]|uniref:hypothetical protein n=1 Tax=Desulfovibrio desulfuricans TaxID=876 RepID=UPI001D0606C1|nr:hypothetical protein [Desulfovibrio desulfuricans]MCB6541121.1 hypothetical protein [Desulfovibrio desulfuricans]MCB6552203.1 hypothetical protein [Desulfovibrio desulfuricans]MCB6564046.1 hypothetical protein [Desulfovibrio desulfuricans]MCB7345226.1 hypothetical protein [Desulfovibrio desulfuricans]MCQ5217320.1 hypothetical protein [Desulfovibrio desulfuricans]